MCYWNFLSRCALMLMLPAPVLLLRTVSFHPYLALLTSQGVVKELRLTHIRPSGMSMCMSFDVICGWIWRILPWSLRARWARLGSTT